MRLAVVIPAFNEADKIAATVRSVPDAVDEVIVVDDASTDATSAVARTSGRAVTVVRHGENRGVGAAIVTGYKHALAHGAEVAVVMAGDGQMDPRDLPALIAPIVDDRADYAKGNRFAHPAVWREMPGSRLVGNVVLSTLTRVTSGYRHVFDSQCGYTAIRCAILRALDLDRVWPRYGYPNDLLARLHRAGARVVDVPVRPIYGETWRSGIDLRAAVHPIPYVLLRSWGGRLAAEHRARG